MGLIKKDECVLHTNSVENGCDVVDGGPVYKDDDKADIKDILYQIMLDQKKIMFEIEYLKKTRL